MYRISAAILALFILTACTLTPQRPDYSQMPQDVFTPIFKKVRGDTSLRLSNMAPGYKLSKALVKDKNREQIATLFGENNAICDTLFSATLMNCSVTRWWTYINPEPTAEHKKNCKPGMQLVYSFYFDESGKMIEVIPPFDFKALHLNSCPDLYAPTPGG